MCQEAAEENQRAIVAKPAFSVSLHRMDPGVEEDTRSTTSVINTSLSMLMKRKTWPVRLMGALQGCQALQDCWWRLTPAFWLPLPAGRAVVPDRMVHRHKCYVWKRTKEKQEERSWHSERTWWCSRHSGVPGKASGGKFCYHGGYSKEFTSSEVCSIEQDRFVRQMNLILYNRDLNMCTSPNSPKIQDSYPQ